MGSPTALDACAEKRGEIMTGHPPNYLTATLEASGDDKSRGNSTLMPTISYTPSEPPKLLDVKEVPFEMKVYNNKGVRAANLLTYKPAREHQPFAAFMLPTFHVLHSR